jgi:hypothetical protein
MLKYITEQSIINAVEKMSINDNINYIGAELLNDLQNEQLFVSPKGYVLNAKHHGGHYSFVEGFIKYIENINVSYFNAEKLYDYIVQDIGFVSLNSGYTSSDYTKAIVWNRPTKEQVDILKFWINDMMDIEVEDIMIVTKHGHKFFKEDDADYHAGKMIKYVQKSFISGVLENTLLAEQEKTKMDRYLKEITEYIIKAKKEYAAAFIDLQEELETRLPQMKVDQFMEQLHNEDLTVEEALRLLEETLE